jgi:hypothetical protein
MLTDEQHGVIRFANGREDVRAAIVRVADLWRSGGTPEQFRAAAGAAARAARAAARAADAWAAARAAGAAARAARAARAADAAGEAEAWTTSACDKLIQLLEAAPVCGDTKY